MTRQLRLHITSGDGIGWAIDQDIRLISQSMGDAVELVGLSEADVVFAPWWECLTGHPRTGQPGLPPHHLNGKRVLCNSPNRPYHEFKDPFFNAALEVVGRWIVVSREAQREMDSVGIPCSLIPYTSDPSTFYRIEESSPQLVELAQAWSIPKDRYIIGNFFRDSEGGTLRRPKLQKGPDLFFVVARELYRQGLPVHFLLAGPRRFWLRDRFDETGIPYSFIGSDVAKGADDIGVNILPRSLLNQLYNLLDLSFVPSRWEGGPHCVMEASLAWCKQLSTHVGVAEDILNPAALFRLPHEAVEIVARDIETDFLADFLDEQHQRVVQNNTPQANAEKWLALLNNIDEIPVCKNAGSINVFLPAKRKGRLRRTLDRLLPSALLKPRPSIYLHHQFFKPPYGGGNQFMMALRRALKGMGLAVRHGKRVKSASVHLLNSVFFSVDAFRSFAKNHPEIKVLHRIDGPIQLYRGFDKELDDQCFALNAELADATVIQSLWAYKQLYEMGYRAVKPVVIPNAVDPRIFHARGRVHFDKRRRTKLISTGWSKNPRKGGPILKWLDDNLDWDRYEYTFVGNVEQEFNHIRHLPAVPSEGLADLLRQHDVYLFLSRIECCSNALIEAMSCGLPPVYFDDTGNPELVGFGGMPFTEQMQIPGLLDKLVDHYDMYQFLLTPPTMDEVSQRYLELIEQVARS